MSQTLTAPAPVIVDLASAALDRLDNEIAEPPYGVERTATRIRAQADLMDSLNAIIGQVPEAVTA